MANTENTDRQYPVRELLRRFAPYYKPYIGVMVFDLFCAALTTLAELVLPMIVRYLTNTALTDASLLTGTVILRLAGLYLVLRLIDTAAAYFMAFQGHVMGTYMETDMRRDAYNHLLKLSDTYFNNTKVGQIMGRITSDLFEVTEFAHHCPEEFFIAGIKFVVSFTLLARINLPLTVVVFAVLPFMIWISSRRENTLVRVVLEMMTMETMTIATMTAPMTHVRMERSWTSTLTKSYGARME